MQIKHNAEKHRFVAFADDGAEMGHIEYSPHDNVLSATHTKVEEAYQGKGVAGKLLDALVEYAAANNMKIIPVCEYVIAAFKKNPEKYMAVVCE